jgi:hypothetical protein
MRSTCVAIPGANAGISYLATIFGTLQNCILERLVLGGVPAHLAVRNSLVTLESLPRLIMLIAAPPRRIANQVRTNLAHCRSSRRVASGIGLGYVRLVELHLWDRHGETVGVRLAASLGLLAQILAEFIWHLERHAAQPGSKV